jgi:uncharacterized membrane protein
MYRKIGSAIGAAAIGVSLAACSTEQVVGGVAAGGAAYEFSNKRAMDDLESDLASGRITRDEYERRKQQIEERSLVY